MAALNDDFFNELPGAICVILTELKKEYGNRTWFPTAWAEYRAHILSNDMDHQKMPGYIFNKYIKGDK